MNGLLEKLRNIQFQPTPATMGLLQGGARMLQASSPSLQPTSFGSALGAGLEGFMGGAQGMIQQQAEREAAQQQQQVQQQRLQILQSQMQQQQAAQAEAARLAEARRKIFAGGRIDDPELINKLAQSGDIETAMDLAARQQAAKRLELQDVGLGLSAGRLGLGQERLELQFDPDVQGQIAGAKQGARIGMVTLPGGAKVPRRLGEAVDDPLIQVGQTTEAKKLAEEGAKLAVKEQEEMNKRRQAFPDAISGIDGTIELIKTLIPIQQATLTGPELASESLLTARKLLPGGENLQRLESGYNDLAMKAFSAMKQSGITFGALDKSEQEWIRSVEVRLANNQKVNLEMLNRGLELLEARKRRMYESIGETLPPSGWTNEDEAEYNRLYGE